MAEADNDGELSRISQESNILIRARLMMVPVRARGGPENYMYGQQNQVARKKRAAESDAHNSSIRSAAGSATIA